MRRTDRAEWDTEGWVGVWGNDGKTREQQQAAFLYFGTDTHFTHEYAQDVFLFTTLTGNVNDVSTFPDRRTLGEDATCLRGVSVWMKRSKKSQTNEIFPRNQLKLHCVDFTQKKQMRYGMLIKLNSRFL